MTTLEQKRKIAAQQETALPYPTTAEYWRRTHFARANLAQFKHLEKEIQVDQKASDFLPNNMTFSGEILFGEQCSAPILSEDLKKQGVILLHLKDAIEQYGDLVLKYLGRGLKDKQHEKFWLQNEAYWQTGVFCYIPANVVVENSILLVQSFTQPQQSLFARTVIVVGKNAQLNLVSLNHSSKETEKNYTNNVIETYLDDGAHLEWVDVQNFSLATYETTLKHTELSANSNLKWFMDLRGGAMAKTDVETLLQGENAHAEIIGLVAAKQKQHLELCTWTHHKSPHTTADILVKGTVNDKAKTVFQGMIKIDKPAQFTESYMANHNLLLSEQAHTDSIPRLEIEADEVKASHGATIGQVDKEQMFYLNSRGFSKQAAEQLLVQGFCEDVFAKVSNETTRDWLRQIV